MFRHMRSCGLLLLLLTACGGGDECGPLEAASGDLSVTVTQTGGCGGATWEAVVTFADGRTQALGGDRNGPVTHVMLGDYSGDGAPDLLVVTGMDRLFGFVQQAGILFGRELPATMGEGTAALRDGRVWVGSMYWDPEHGVWMRGD